MSLEEANSMTFRRCGSDYLDVFCILREDKIKLDRQTKIFVVFASKGCLRSHASRVALEALTSLFISTARFVHPPFFPPPFLFHPHLTWFLHTQNLELVSIFDTYHPPVPNLDKIIRKWLRFHVSTSQSKSTQSKFLKKKS